MKISSDQNKNKIVKTYAEDMAEVIQNDRGGLIKKIIHGEEEHEKEKRNLSPESKKNRFFMLTGVLLVVLALATLFFFLFNKDISTISVEKQLVPLFFTDKNVFMEVKGFKKDDIVQTVFREVKNTEVKKGGVEGIYLSSDKKIIGWKEFIAFIKGNFESKAPVSGGDDSLIDDNFLLGVVNGETKDFFILLKVRSIPDIFDSLRAWENKMFLDLHGFFEVDISPETKYLLTANFEDGVVDNKNARILYTTDRKIVMMYVFADDTSVIITNAPNVTHEIILRLASSQVEK
jgi:hypothetical protein